jgi:DinB superfamily
MRPLSISPIHFEFKGANMHAKDVIRNSLDSSERIINAYINDLDNADLLVRPVAGANHIAWQLGHLILTERNAMEALQPGASPALPPGFEAGHGRDCFVEDDASKFLPRASYQEIWRAQRAATKAILDGMSDETLDSPAPERFQRIAPTIGAAMNLMGMHPLMHAGQFVAVRRLKNKPVAI